MDSDTTLRVFIAALRRRTGASVFACRRALVECGMDFEAARQVVIVRVNAADAARGGGTP